jgi:multisubunit Na+/H+ antiporter MnhB subunit
LRINGSADQYVIEHSLLYRKEEGAYRAVDEEFSSGDMKPDVRVEEPSGVPYSHLYVRGLTKEPPTKRLLTVVKFAEVPPGVLGMATLASLLLTLFIVGFTIFSPNHPGLKDPIVALPGFLVTLLAVLISWMGFNSDRESVLRASMSARSGLVAVIVILLASVLLYANKWIYRPTRSLEFFGGSWEWSDLNVWWIGLSCVSILVSLTLLVVFAVRTLRYMRVIKGRNIEYVTGDEPAG